MSFFLLPCWAGGTCQSSCGTLPRRQELAVMLVRLRLLGLPGSGWQSTVCPPRSMWNRGIEETEGLQVISPPHPPSSSQLRPLSTWMEMARAHSGEAPPKSLLMMGAVFWGTLVAHEACCSSPPRHCSVSGEPYFINTGATTPESVSAESTCM